jgi:hypothetical protein
MLRDKSGKMIPFTIDSIKYQRIYLTMDKKQKKPLQRIL